MKINYLKSFIKIINHPLNKPNRIGAILRIIWWKSNQLFFKFSTIVQISPQRKIICTPDDSYSASIVYMSWPEYDVMNFIYNYLKKDSIYIDVGAHIGSEVLLASSKIKNGRIYAFEPTPSTFAKLMSNIFLNGLDNKLVKVLPLAISNKNGFTDLVLENESEINHLKFGNNNLKKTKLVKTAMLDWLFENEKIESIDLLKIDVEGAEPLVFGGMKNSLIEKKVKVIVFEVNKNLFKYNFNSNKLIRLLEKFEYKIYNFQPNHKLRLTNSHDFKFEETTNLVAVIENKLIKKFL